MSADHRQFPTDRETLEREVELEFVRGSGPGGQHKNRRETGVRLFHPPSGLTVMATERRSQAQNRAAAFERLIARLEELNHVPKERVPTAVPARVGARRLDVKKRTAEKKALRKSPDSGEW